MLFTNKVDFIRLTTRLYTSNPYLLEISTADTKLQKKGESRVNNPALAMTATTQKARQGSSSHGPYVRRRQHPLKKRKGGKIEPSPGHWEE